MSAFVRDVFRYHHWPSQKDYWVRRQTAIGGWTSRSLDDSPQGVSGDYVGNDNRISPQNLERVRYHYWDNRKHRNFSERQEYDFMHSNNITTLTAPFGTTDTPNISYKIIGSKPVHVIESLQPQTERSYNGNIYTGPRIHNLDGITGKPTQVDARILNEKTKGYYSAQEDQFSSHVHGKPTYSNPVTYRGPRPDSKTFSPYPNLPPIEANRGKNQRSTVFEKESWIPPTGEEPKLSTDTEYKQQFETARPSSERNRPSNQTNFDRFYQNGYKTQSESGAPISNRYKSVPNGNGEFTMERSFKSDMLRMLPPGPFLPSDPFRYSQDERKKLLDITAEEMRGVTTDRLKGAYQLLSRSDRDLKGLCHFEQIKQVLVQERADPSEDTLKLISAMYVNPKIQNVVNYEDIITFLNEAIKQSHNGNMCIIPDRSPRSPQHEIPKVRNISIPREKETASLLQKTAQQLGTNKINIENLIRTFQLYDSERGEMLSANEIKNVLFDNKIQLSDSLIDDILAKMTDANRDGKFNWRRFVDFLERVQPANTGLEISYNKRPLEYAKQYPIPVDSWPRAKESPRYSSPPPPANHYGQRSPLFPRKDFGYSPHYNGPTGPGEHIWRKIKEIEDEIRNLEQSNKMLRQGLESDKRGDSWEAKLIQLAGQLYRIDESRYNSRGLLPYEMIVDQSMKYNYNARMGLPEDVIYRIAQRHGNDRNQVDIAKFLDDLGNERTWYQK